MEITFVFTLLLSGALASAQTTTSSTTSTATTLPELVSGVSPCVLSCVSDVSSGIGCSSSDFDCICDRIKRFSLLLTPCLVGSDCGSDAVNDAGERLPRICDALEEGVDKSVKASASQILSQAIASATATSDAPEPSASDSGSGSLQYGGWANGYSFMGLGVLGGLAAGY